MDWNRLYRNEGGMKFKDGTEEAGIAGAGYSMADFDTDGKLEVRWAERPDADCCRCQG